MRMNPKSAVTAINRAGALLVFPIGNRKEPASLWSHFYPRSEMRWEWDEAGDDRVSRLWHLKTELSTTRQVVYTKWYQGRATYFSKPLFAAMLRSLNPEREIVHGLSANARKLLEALGAESPLSTKELKRVTDLRGKACEGAYEKALKELWARLLIVAFGEVEDGAFPSLAVGSTRILFEDVWGAAFSMEPAEAASKVSEVLSRSSPFFRHYEKMREQRSRVEVPPQRGSGRSGPKIASVVRFEDLSSPKR